MSLKLVQLFGYYKANVSEVREPGTMLLRVCRPLPKKLSLSLSPGARYRCLQLRI